MHCVMCLPIFLHNTRTGAHCARIILFAGTPSILLLSDIPSTDYTRLPAIAISHTLVMRAQAKDSALAAARAEAAAANNALKTVETGINYYAMRKEYLKLKDIAEASDVAGKVRRDPVPCMQAHCNAQGSNTSSRTSLRRPTWPARCAETLYPAYNLSAMRKGALQAQGRRRGVRQGRQGAQRPYTLHPILMPCARSTSSSWTSPRRPTWPARCAVPHCVCPATAPCTRSS